MVYGLYKPKTITHTINPLAKCLVHSGSKSSPYIVNKPNKPIPQITIIDDRFLGVLFKKSQ